MPQGDGMMDTKDKIELLGRAAQYDLCSEACGTEAKRVRDDIGRWIYPVVLPDGRRIALLKVLMTNACENDCYYCAQRASRDCLRTRFAPDELAKLFDMLHRQRRVQGIFLSSSVFGGPDCTMEQMLAAIELIRRKCEFAGYVHLKILPGAHRAAVEQAVQLANRVSVNLEAPNPQRLAALSSTKDFHRDLLTRMRWAAEAIQRAPGADPGSRFGAGHGGLTTQFVVGAAKEPDREIMATAAWLYKQLDLRRAYYSAFQPVVNTPLEGETPTPPLREHRLYQSDWLLRQYGFQLEELVFDEEGNLPQEADPKIMWAKAHPERFPIEINRADRWELLRIPGVGPRSASRILKLRREQKLHDLSDLQKIGAVAERAAPYILLDGRRPMSQLPLW